MSVESLLNHTCTVYRLGEAVGKYREVKNEYTAGATELLALNRSTLSRQDEGAGEGMRGFRTAYMRVGADLLEEDVLDVTDGPDAPQRLRVTRISRPRGHHAELECEPFNGTLTVAES